MEDGRIEKEGGEKKKDRKKGRKRRGKDIILPSPQKEQTFDQAGDHWYSG